MRVLKERTEIAKAINGHEMPVVTIDLAEAEEYGLKSQKVLIDNGKFKDGFPFYIKSEIRAYSDNEKFVFTQGATVLSASFTYSDIKEMLEYRNAPIVKADENIIICVIDSEKKFACNPIVLHTSKRIDSNCIIPLEFEDKDYSTKPFLKLTEN